MIAHWPSATRSEVTLAHAFDLERTYDRYAKLLFSIAYAVVHDRADAEDCVHDTLLKIWKSPESYDEARGDLKSFLAVAVRNAAISLLRKRARRQDIEKRLPAISEAEEPPVLDYLEQSSLRSALQSLPPDQWSVLRLAYFEHLTHVQIAERLELPLGTVKSRIALAIRKLHNSMPPRVMEA